MYCNSHACRSRVISKDHHDFETDEFDSSIIEGGELPLYRRSNSVRTRKDKSFASEGMSSKVIAESVDNFSTSLDNVKIGLGLKFSLPIIFVFVLVILAFTYFIAVRSSESLTNEILKSGLSQVAILSDYGAMIIEKADRTFFMYGRKGKYEPWPVDLGLISKNEFLKRIGYFSKDLPSRATQNYIMNQKTLFAAQTGGLLKEIIAYRGRDGVLHSTQVLAAYVLTTDKNLLDFYLTEYTEGKVSAVDSLLLARSEMSYEIGEGSEGSLPIVRSPWVDEYADISKCIIEEKEVYFDSIQTPCTVYDGIVLFAGAKYADYYNQPRGVKSLIFDMPIFNNNNKIVGKAIIALGASQIITQLKKTYQVFIIAAVLAIVLSVAVSIILSYIVTRPVKILLADMNEVAKGNLNHETKSHSCDEIGVIANHFNHLTKLINAASESEKKGMRLESELEMACEIQMKLLPPRLPEIKGIDIFAAYQPAKEVGGDYYDIFPIDEQNIGMVIADVSGKGVPGSMVMATTRTILRFAAKGTHSARDTLIKTNLMVSADIKRGMFVTAFYLIYNIMKKEILFSSAGHNPMIVCHADREIEQFNPEGIALGFDKGEIFGKTIKEGSLKLKSGDRVILYTDGIVESMNEHREEFTDEKFEEFICKSIDQSSENFVAGLLTELDEHQGEALQHDDITILTFKVL